LPSIDVQGNRTRFLTRYMVHLNIKNTSLEDLYSQ